MTIFEIFVEKLKLVTGDVNTTVVLTRQQSPQLQQKQCRRQSFRQKCFHHLNHQNLLLFGFLHCRVLMKLSHVLTNSKLGCVFPMVIWPAFRMGQYRVNDHPYYARLSATHPGLETRNLEFENLPRMQVC